MECKLKGRLVSEFKYLGFVFFEHGKFNRQYEEWGNYYDSTTVYESDSLEVSNHACSISDWYESSSNADTQDPALDRVKISKV